MKVLVTGNSQSSCLKKAFDEYPRILSQHEVSFFVTPGGTGPYFTVKDDRLNVIDGNINPNFPPRVYPEVARDRPLSYYDAIIVSALGYIDGGFKFSSSITTRGLLATYRPRKNRFSEVYISKSCYRQSVHTFLNDQPGVKFLLSLKGKFDGRIIVQPFPLFSEILIEHPDWPLNQMYDDPLGAHKFFLSCQETCLEHVCEEASAMLLPYPNRAWRSDLFAPRKFMSDLDGLHPLENYGAMVLKQLAGVLS